MFRGNQAKYALDSGAAAIVFFKDLSKPQEDKRFPQSEWAPDTAGARGTIRMYVRRTFYSRGRQTFVVGGSKNGKIRNLFC